MSYRSFVNKPHLGIYNDRPRTGQLESSVFELTSEPMVFNTPCLSLWSECCSLSQFIPLTRFVAVEYNA